jgi:sugar-specific transcriptional regulator TrmB
METLNTLKYLEIFEKLGLNKNEAQIYELLVNSGPLGVKPILFNTKLKRGNAYYHLDSLKAKGLVETATERGRTIFAGKNPEQLELLLAKQKAALAAAEEELSKSLPELRSVFQLATTKPGVKFYEGKEGIIRIYEYLLAQGANIDSVEDKGEMAVFIPEYVKEFVAKRIKKNIFNRVIAPANNPININSPKELREVRMLPAAQFPFRMDIKIVGNAVSLISFQKDNPIGILIENKEIADNFRILFELIWKLLEPKTGLKIIPAK